MPFWVTNRWRDPDVRDVVEQQWTELPEDVNPNDAPGQQAHWTRLDGVSLPRPNTEREPLTRVVLGLPGETDRQVPGTAHAPPAGWVWYTDATHVVDGRRRRYWVRTDGRHPSDVGYPGYRHNHGWIRWHQNTWAPSDCRRHPEPVPGQWECHHCGVPQGPAANRNTVTLNAVATSVCNVCRPAVIGTCHSCSTEHHIRSMHRGLNFRVGRGQYDTARRDVCVPCWDRRIGTSTMVPAETRHAECLSCGQFAPLASSVRVGNTCLCQYCDTVMQGCPFCHHVVRRNTLRRDGTRCDYCVERVIRAYSDRTANNLGPFGVSKVKTRNGRSYDSTIRYGVELEIEVNDEGAYNLNEKAEEALAKIGEDFAIVKGDGSLCNGFELVTAPAPISVHRERFEKLLGKRIRGLTCESGRCGMHVHVSRAPLTQLQIGKLITFVNDPSNRAFIKSIAGRDANHYCKTVPKKVKDVRHDNADRYQSINLTNRHTIEFRIFKGTTNLQSVMRNLEFVAAAVEWASQASMARLGHLDFCEYVGKTPKYYPSLVKWMRMKGYLKSPKPPMPPKPNTQTKE